jgi:hypothetical protein
MKLSRKTSLLILACLLLALAMGCGSEKAESPEKPELEESTAESNLLDSAKDAVGEAGDGIGEVVEQAAKSAQTAVGTAGDAVQDTAGQVGDALQAAATVVVDQGGEAVEAVTSAGQSTSEAVRERVASLQPDEDGNFTVTIHEDEINKIIKIQELFTDTIPGNPLKNTIVAFSEGVIVFTADVFEPFVGQLVVGFNPYVDEGHVRFEVVDASLGSSETPQSVLDAAAKTLGSTLGEALSFLPGGLRPREIIVTNGTFTLKGGGVDDGG